MSLRYRRCGQTRLGRRLVRLVLVAGLGATPAILGCAGAKQSEVGRDLIAQGKYDEAVEALRQAAAQDPTNSGYLSSLGEAESLAADRRIDAADKLIAEHKPTEARAELLRALEYMPAHPRAMVMLRTVDRQLNGSGPMPGPLAAQVPASGGKSAEATRVTQAPPSNPRAGEEPRVNPRSASAPQESPRSTPEPQPSPRAAPSARESPRVAQAPSPTGKIHTEAKRSRPEQDTRVGQLLTQAEAELKARRFRAAVELLDQALAAAPRREDLRQRRREVLCWWADADLSECERLAGKGEWEPAWVQGIRAAVVCPDVRSRALQTCGTLEDSIRRAIAYKLSVLPLRSVGVAGDDVIAVTQVLADELAAVKPDHVRLVQPPDLAAFAQEHGLAAGEAVDRAKLAEVAGKLDGSDALVLVEVVPTRRVGVAGRRYDADPATRAAAVRVRLRLVDPASGRGWWTDEEIEVQLPKAEDRHEAAGDGASDTAANPGTPLLTKAAGKLRPILRAKAKQLLVQWSARHWERAQAVSVEQAPVEMVRFLFDGRWRPDARAAASALDKVFVAGAPAEIGQECRKLAVERLGLHLEEQPPPPARVEIGPPPDDSAKPGADDQARAIPVTAYRGTISRDDKRFAKSVRTIDGIEVKVEDTDADPVDADLEVRVGGAKITRNDLRVGAGVSIRLQSGRAYRLVILAIEHESDTVHFVVERITE